MHTFGESEWNILPFMHPSLCSTIEETEEGFLQRFDKDIRPRIVPEKMSQGEMERVAKELRGLIWFL